MQKQSVLILLVVLFLLPAVSIAQVEPVISYQGVLTDDSGAPLNGTFDMYFRIKDSTDVLWEELHNGVPVDSGFFSVMLGDTDPIPPDAFVSESDSGNAMRYLEVQVGADLPMTPLTRLLSAPYSMASHRMAGDIFTSPGSIRMGIEPVPFLPQMELNVFQDSASIRMGVEPEPFEPTVEINTNPNTTSFRMGVEPQPFEPAVEINASQNTTTFSMGVEPDPFDPAPEMEMLMDQNSTTFKMGIDPQPFQPTVEINSSLNTTTFRMGIEPEPFSPDPEVVISMDSNSTSFRMGVDPEPFNPTVAINSSPNTTTFRMGIEPQPFDPAPEMEMLMDENSTTFRMGVDPQPFKPSMEFQALTDESKFTIFDPSAGTTGGPISEMSGSVGGQFSWLMFNPQPEPPGRPIMDMNTGPGGEFSWVMFNPQPEPPAIGVLGMKTTANGAEISMTSPQYGVLTDVNSPMIKLETLGELANFTMSDPTAGTDGGPVSEMTVNIGGQFSWLMFNPQPEPPGRPIMDMNTGPGGEISWVMFNPQPEPPGHAWMNFGTDANGPSFEMTAPGQYGGMGLDITAPMLRMDADSAGPEFSLKRNFLGVTGGQDSSGISMMVDSTQALFDLFGPFSFGNPGVRMVNTSSGPMIGIGVNPTNILTVKQGSATDPIADAWMVYTLGSSRENTRQIEGALDKVLRLRGVSYERPGHVGSDIGFVAEEVAEVLPEAVAYDKDGGNAIGMDYSRVTPILLEAMKEQQHKIDRLESEIGELRRMITTLQESRK